MDQKAKVEETYLVLLSERLFAFRNRLGEVLQSNENLLIKFKGMGCAEPGDESKSEDTLQGKLDTVTQVIDSQLRMLERQLDVFKTVV